MSFRKIGSVIVVFFLFFLYGLVTLPNYGTDWDTINHLPRGQAYLRYFLTGEKTYDKLPEYVDYNQKDNALAFSPDKPKNLIPKRSLYQISGYDALYFLAKDGGHPPLSDILSSVSNVIFFQQLRLVNDIDSYHIYIIFMASLLVSSVFWWTKKHYGNFVALIAALSLVLYPLFLGESHFNLKDIPEAAFYSLMLIFLYEGITRKKSMLILISAIFFGCAWGTKFNILFAPIIVVPWFILYAKTNFRSLKQALWLIPSIITFPLIAVAIFWGSWPYLWKNSFAHFLNIVNYYKTIGINTSFDPSFIHLGFNTYAIQWIIYTTPMITLFFTFLGATYVILKGRYEIEKTAFFVLLWFIVPIARVTMPNAGIYGGVRQIMEFIPAMAILSGIGAKFILEIININIIKKLNNNFNIVAKQFRKLTIKPLLLMEIVAVMSFIPITLKLISIHPNENVYFNPLIGGLSGAREKNIPYWGNSFGNAYRQAVHWINAHAESKSTLVLSQELMPNLPKQLVRSDITYTNSLRSGYMRKGEYVIGLKFGLEANESYYSSRYYNRYLNPIYQIKIDNVSILNIWKNDVMHTKKAFLSEESISDPSYEKIDKGIIVDLQKPFFISRIKWDFLGDNCPTANLIYFNISLDKNSWERTAHSFPMDRPIPILEAQPTIGNSIDYPFAAEYAHYILIVIDPINSCVSNIKSLSIYFLPDVSLP